MFIAVHQIAFYFCTLAEETDEKFVLQSPMETTSEANDSKDAAGRKADKEDKLVCGRCEAQFPIGQIQLFIQHKQEQCLNNLTEPALSELRQLSRAAEASPSDTYQQYRHDRTNRPSESQGELIIRLNHNYRQ